MNQLFYGDNLEVMQKFIKDESVDLCYIDPPFNSKRDYNIIYQNTGKETAQVQAFIDTWTWDDAAAMSYQELTDMPTLLPHKTYLFIRSMVDIFGKCELTAYLLYMSFRIKEIHRVLKPTGSFYLHCDPTMSHYLKILLDSFFSEKGEFRNEIIWRIGWVSGYKTKANKLIRNHDVILYYNKSSKFTFNKQYIKYEENYVRRDGKKPTGKGIPLEDTWNCSKGDQLNSIAIMSFSKEKLRYETQKPEALLERIIKASSNEGDVVLDAFCGCGTTIAVAHRLNRKWIGIDISYNSISIIKKRMLDTFGKDITSEFIELGEPKDLDSAKELALRKGNNRKEFEKWSIAKYTNNRAFVNDKKGGDGGIDGTAYINIDDKENKKILFSVKTGQKLTPSVIRDLFGVVEREDAAIGILITLEPFDNLVREAKKYGYFRHPLTGKQHEKIQVIDIVKIMEGATLDLNLVDILKRAERKHKVKQLKMEEK